MKFSVEPRIKELTTKQSSIVASETYPQYLKAGAGTGKTEVLVQKIIHILNNDSSSDISNFAIITFTNKATEEMKRRISDILYKNWISDGNQRTRKNIDVVSMSNISTIHLFCENLIREFGLQINISPNFKVKSFKKQSDEIVSNILNKYWDKSLLREFQSFTIIRLLTILISNNSNRGIRISKELSERLCTPVDGNDFWNEFKVLFLEIYNTIEETIINEKRKNNILTPNDLIYYASQLLENDIVLDRVSKRYKYIFIDEFQDTNNDQFKFVQKLINKGVKVFLVGDDKQSIYAFRGADIQNSIAMHNYIKSINENTDKNFLDENFRSEKSVIETINSLFSKDFKFNNQTLCFPKEPLRVPKSANNQDSIEPLKVFYEKRTSDIIKDILTNTEIKGDKAKYGDIAVLCRRNFDLDIIANELKASGIPVCVVGGKGFYRAKPIIDTYKFLNAAVSNDLSAKNELVFTDYYNSICTISNNIDIEKLLSEVSDILRIRTVEESLTFLFEKSNIFDYYRAKNDYQSISNLLKLKDIARDLINKDEMQPLRFVDYLYIMISTKQDEDEAEVSEGNSRDGVVALYSIHRAKGLSFPIVIIPCCDNKLNRPITKPKIILDTSPENPSIAFDSDFISEELPVDIEYERLLNNNTIEQLEEEIRVFYVACTRAEKQIILLNSNSKEKIKQTLNFSDYASISKWLLESEQI